MKKNYLLLMLLFAGLFSNVSLGQFLYPGGDTCATAVPVPVGDGFYSEYDEFESDHWYSFVAPCDGDLVVSNGGHSSNRRIHSGVCESLTLIAEGTWADSEVAATMLAGETVYIQVNDGWDGAVDFNVEFDICDEIDSTLLDIQGTVYYDMNENGVKDVGEDGKYLTSIVSDPAGVFTVSGADGHYYRSVVDLEDDVYELYPNLDEHWGISSDSLTYTIVVYDTYEQRDSLDFGLYPDTLFYEVNEELIGGFPRCNDTINYWLSVQNTGTMIASGLMHLEIDDSLYYVSADVLPDSIVGKHLYWNYEDLFFNEFYSVTVEIGTPDGVEDTVSSSLTVNVESAGAEVYTSTEILERVITCAYDPNDKTPTPLGVGEFGYIPPTTETIEYLIRFQNTGTDTAFNVVITDQLDENLDWYSITPLAYSHDMRMEMDIDGEVSFVFENIMLPDSNVNYVGSNGFVKYSIDLKPGLPLETSIFNTANIYFDLNPAVVTNTAINTLHVDDVSVDELIRKEQLLVYPNPSNESTTIYFGKELNDYAIQITDVLGKQVYLNDQLVGSKLEIETGHFKQGMYVLLLVDKKLGQTVSTTKLMVE